MSQEYATKADVDHVIQLIKTEIKHLRELMDQHDSMAQTAIDKSDTSMDERLAKVNEFREQQTDLITNFATKEFLTSQLEAQSKRLEILEKAKENSVGANRIILIVATLASGFITFVAMKLFK